MILFCLPHAGSTGLSYYKWKLKLDKNIKFVTIDLPGHNLCKESKFIYEFDIAIEYLYEQIFFYLHKHQESYAIFGHSMGAVFAYELYYKLTERTHFCLEHLLLSGRIPPGIYSDMLQIEFLKSEDTFNYLKNNFFDQGNYEINQSLLEIYSDILLADMVLMRNYKPNIYLSPILADVTILFGHNDQSTPFIELRKWNQICSGRIQYVQIKGDHLFPIDNATDVVKEINKILGQHEK